MWGLLHKINRLSVRSNHPPALASSLQFAAVTLLNRQPQLKVFSVEFCSFAQVAVGVHQSYRGQFLCDDCDWYDWVDCVQHCDSPVSVVFVPVSVVCLTGEVYYLYRKLQAPVSQFLKILFGIGGNSVFSQFAIDNCPVQNQARTTQPSAGRVGVCPRRTGRCAPISGPTDCRIGCGQCYDATCSC